MNNKSAGVLSFFGMIFVLASLVIGFNQTFWLLHEAGASAARIGAYWAAVAFLVCGTFLQAADKV